MKYKIAAYIFLAILAFFIVLGLWPYLTGMLSAFILFSLFNPIFLYMEKKGIKTWINATIVVFISILIILIPVSILIGVLGTEVTNALAQRETLVASISELSELLPQYNLAEETRELITTAGTYFRNLLISTVQSAGNIFINLFICYALFIYFLTHQKFLTKKLKAASPFSKSHTDELLKEFKNVTYTTVYATGLISIFQGVLMGITFAILGIQGALLWGFITAILSFIPMVGVPLILIPATLLQIFQGEYAIAIILVIAGTIIANVDNFIRPGLQRRLGRMHWLTSLMGVFIGVNLLGLIGIVVGPLLVSYFLIALKMLEY